MLVMRKTGNDFEPRKINVEQPRFVTQITKQDVLLGRGSLKNSHPGNVKYRDIIKNRKVEYIAASQHQPKKRIAQEIIDQISAYNGRFLREVRTSAEAKMLGIPLGTQAWVIASDSDIHAKVKQALREGENKPREEKQSVPENDNAQNASSFVRCHLQERGNSTEDIIARHDSSYGSFDLHTDSNVSSLITMQLAESGSVRPDSVSLSSSSGLQNPTSITQHRLGWEQQQRSSLPISQSMISENNLRLLSQSIFSRSNHIGFDGRSIEEGRRNVDLIRILSQSHSDNLPLSSTEYLRQHIQYLQQSPVYESLGIHAIRHLTSLPQSQLLPVLQQRENSPSPIETSSNANVTHDTNNSCRQEGNRKRKSSNDDDT